MQQSMSGYEATGQSPVPSLTAGTSQLSSASSSVNTLSPDILAARNLLPRFEATRDMACKHAVQASEEAGGEHVVQASEDTRKRRRESATEQSRKRAMRQPRQRPTGSTDFVGKYGLNGLYDEFVRPYVGERRRALPDLGTAYLRDVGVEPQARTVDLLELVLGPAKNDFDKLDLLPRASIKAAFRIGAGSHTGEAKRSRVSLKMSDASHKRQRSESIKHDDYERQRPQQTPSKA
ncbi:hypothetical protein EV183_000509 [Coemansia sp. RSA 2336]|nr:hypothetical protein EV183_000509 [Coemansia sp. RSA 2336]